MSLLMKRPKTGPGPSRAAPSEPAGGALPLGTAAPVNRGRTASATAAPASRSAAPAEDALWVDKFAPRSAADLAVHKKKVEEVQQWLQQANVSLELGLPPASRLLVLSGPPGAGKSATLRVLACAAATRPPHSSPPHAHRGHLVPQVRDALRAVRMGRVRRLPRSPDLRTRLSPG
jgi:hypothetical protein